MPIYLKKEEVESTVHETILSKKSVGLVPTMGSLHHGHLSLIEKANKENDIVWVSIFINPTQFNDPQDLNRYPKNFEKDYGLIKNICKKIKIFSPNVKEIYGKTPTLQKYDFKKIDVELEGKHRKNHFNGVATIVSKLLTLIKPNKVYFGEKDYQQTQIIKKLICLENINVNMIICPTVREKNGLALSSRNNFLSNIDRDNSSIIYKSLNLLKFNFNNSNLKSLRKNIVNDINKKKNFKVEYLEIANAETLQIDEKINPTKQYRAFICVSVNEVRLIDNILLN